jgi:hypothetical protein
VFCHAGVYRVSEVEGTASAKKKLTLYFCTRVRYYPRGCVLFERNSFT